MPVLLRRIEEKQDVYVVAVGADKVKKVTTVVGISDDYCNLELSSFTYKSSRSSLQSDGFFAVLTKEELIKVIPNLLKDSEFVEALNLESNGLPNYVNRYRGHAVALVRGCQGDINITYENNGVCLLDPNFDPTKGGYFLHNLVDGSRGSTYKYRGNTSDTRGVVFEHGEIYPISGYKLVDIANDADHLVNYKNIREVDEIKERLVYHFQGPVQVNNNVSSLESIVPFMKFQNYLTAKYPDRPHKEAYGYRVLFDNYNHKIMKKHPDCNLILDFAEYVVMYPNTLEKFNTWNKWLNRPA